MAYYTRTVCTTYSHALLCEAHTAHHGRSVLQTESCSTSRVISRGAAAVLLLFAGVEPNPGPPVKFGFINARSIVRRGSLISDMITTHDLDVLAVAETWIREDDPDAIKLDSSPSGYGVVHVPRPSRTNRSRGGGLCVIHRESIRVKPQRTAEYNSFECQLLKLVCTQNKTVDNITMATIYRPPTSAADGAFYDELSCLFDGLGDVIDGDRFVCCGDFNCAGDDEASISPGLLTVLDAHGLQQLVQSPTRTTNHTRSLLDLVICSSSSTRVSQVAVQPSHQVSDHDLVTWSTSASLRTKPQLVSFKFRTLKNVDWARFQDDLRQSELFKVRRTQLMSSLRS